MSLSFMKKGFFLAIITIVAFAGFLSPAFSEQEEITFSMLPQMSNADTFKFWMPIFTFLEKETGIKCNQVFPKDFDEHIKLCREGTVKLAYTNPFSYIKIAPSEKDNRATGHTAIAIAADSLGATMHGEFITREDSPDIKEFKDIKGKKGWIVGFKSAGGYFFQQAYALDHGIDLTKDCTLTESPNNKQEKVVMAVFNRETDFGCIRNGIREKMKDRVDLAQIKVLTQTDNYPNWVISLSDTLDAKTAEKLKAAFLKMPADVLKEAGLPGNVEKFLSATDADLNSIRALEQKIGKLD